MCIFSTGCWGFLNYLNCNTWTAAPPIYAALEVPSLKTTIPGPQSTTNNSEVSSSKCYSDRLFPFSPWNGQYYSTPLCSFCLFWVSKCGAHSIFESTTLTQFSFTMTTYYVPDTMLGMRKPKTKVYSLLVRNWQFNGISALSGLGIFPPITERQGDNSFSPVYGQFTLPYGCVAGELLQPPSTVHNLWLNPLDQHSSIINISLFLWGKQEVWKRIFHIVLMRFHFTLDCWVQWSK